MIIEVHLGPQEVCKSFLGENSKDYPPDKV